MSSTGAIVGPIGGFFDVETAMRLDWVAYQASWMRHYGRSSEQIGAWTHAALEVVYGAQASLQPKLTFESASEVQKRCLDIISSMEDILRLVIKELKDI